MDSIDIKELTVVAQSNSDSGFSPAEQPPASTNRRLLEVDEEAAIKNLTENVRDQDDLERDISFQASLALIEAEDRKDEKRIERAEANKLRLEQQKKTLQAKLRTSSGNPTATRRIENDISGLDADIDLNKKDVADFRKRIEQRHQQGADDLSAGGKGTKKLSNETHREYLIRTGKITPFAKIGGSRPEGVEGDLADAIIDAEDEAVAEELEKAEDQGPRSHRNLRLPGFAEDSDVASSSAVESEFSLRPRKRRKIPKTEPDSDDEFRPPSGAASPEDDALEEASDGPDLTSATSRLFKRKRGGKNKAPKARDTTIDLSGIDDGYEAVYQQRLANWVERRRRARRRHRESRGEPLDDDREAEEWFKPAPDHPDHHFENGLKLPGDIYPSLFDYQKTGVQWLAELYEQKVGGIVGDEMGLGKTVQLISFVAGLHYSKKLTQPVIVVAPATLLQQWVNEFHRWWPPLRVSILHSSGSGMLQVGNEDLIEEEELWDDENKLKQPKSLQAAKKIVDRVVKHGHVLVTTYAGLQTYRDVLIPVSWGYAVLDEGHKIRNPNTSLTVYCKELRTANRIILSGTPMQNNLTELWSLFDFIYPMRLGTLVDFRTKFEIPIRLGGYANATNLQIMTAEKCAETLKDTISPYLLQRVKADVAADLPKKSEQVLFCKLTQIQRDAYELFLKSEDMNAILNKTRQSFFGIDYLRKICNHPDLINTRMKNDPSYKWGSANKSGKMQVVKALVHMWKKFGHKTLLFSQGVQMLDILENFLRRQNGIRYLRMDGKTPIKERQALVDEFNENPNVDLFLLTTKVGGLGTNLTGADRVIIFDPDWNPSTDVQARERAWRLGQKNEVTIYRLMTAGTIEEKIYHRQIFKQFLTNKVLKDPKQRSAFAMSDLHDLFSLGSYEDGSTETGELFRGSEVNKSGKSTGRKNLIMPGSDSHHMLSHPQSMPSADNQRDNEEDVRRIDGLAGMEIYKEGEDGAQKPTDEDRIMEGIFSRSVHSALEHDNIINGSGGKPKPDRSILQWEANRVAADAAAALRRAGEQASNVPIGTVTWTGEVGEAGRPTNIRRGRAGPGSGGIVAGLADRQGISSSGAAVGGSGRSSPARGAGGAGRAGVGSSGSGTPILYSSSDFIRMIPRFMMRHGGQVPSKLLVDHFNQYCSGSRQSSEFKVALNRVAVLDKKGSSMRGIWSLKSEYRTGESSR